MSMAVDLPAHRGPYPLCHDESSMQPQCWGVDSLPSSPGGVPPWHPAAQSLSFTVAAKTSLRIVQGWGCLWTGVWAPSQVAQASLDAVVTMGEPGRPADARSLAHSPCYGSTSSGPAKERSIAAFQAGYEDGPSRSSQSHESIKSASALSTALSY
ncbi:hypothetical protein G7046_g4489 [Stylonectria norvegica]|nr:hypothetical protein G7046_g4489 [Stylonectria norvegica]